MNIIMRIAQEVYDYNVSIHRSRCQKKFDGLSHWQPKDLTQFNQHQQFLHREVEMENQVNQLADHNA
jgi:hypothetical protein